MILDHYNLKRKLNLFPLIGVLWASPLFNESHYFIVVLFQISSQVSVVNHYS